MAKIPRAGEVKTRLCPPLSPVDAAELHAIFLRATLSRLRHSGAWGSVVWSFAGGALAEARAIGGDGIEVIPQVGGDLGDRIVDVARSLAGRYVAFFGADTPHVPETHHAAIAEAAAGGVAAIGPSDDGGFWTIGLPGSVDVATLLADVRWSSGHELDDVRRNAGRDGVRLLGLPAFWDVDRPDDLARLVGGASGAKADLVPERIRRLVVEIPAEPRRPHPQ